MLKKKRANRSKNSTEIRIQGLPICSGIGIGGAVLFSFTEGEIPEFSLEDQEIEGEIERYRRALQRSKSEVQKLKSKLEDESAWDGVAILETHLHMLQDPILTVDVEEQIRHVRKNTEAIVKARVSEYQQRFNKIGDSFFKERFQDIQDISRRIIRHLQEMNKCSLADVPHNSIIFAEELTPSDTAEARGAKIGAFVTERGGLTSHMAIMAKAQGIPYVANIALSTVHYTPQTGVIVDGFSGQVIFNPTKKTLWEYRQRHRVWKMHAKTPKTSHLSCETIDGYKIKLTANVELLPEVDLIFDYGGEGIGLFRSESLLMQYGKFPSEEEQFAVYRRFIESMKGLPVTIRTFDIGGDKFGRFYVEKREDNPFLGCRAIRLMLKEKELFKTQLRAILRASVYGPLNLLFPMISKKEELVQVKELLEIAKRELSIESKELRIGCMVEVPSAALMADFLAEECDFLSIGTNDLIQYTMAVDRGNQAMSYLYTPLHVSVLRLIHATVEAASKRGKPVTVCGEMAGDPLYTKLLLGLGVHGLSVIPRMIPAIKNVVRSSRILSCVKMAEKVLACSSEQEIADQIRDQALP